MPEQENLAQVERDNEMYHKTQEAAHRQVDETADTVDRWVGEEFVENHQSAVNEALLADEAAKQFYEENKDALHQIALNEAAERSGKRSLPQ